MDECPNPPCTFPGEFLVLRPFQGTAGGIKLKKICADSWLMTRALIIHLSPRFTYGRCTIIVSFNVCPGLAIPSLVDLTFKSSLFGAAAGHIPPSTLTQQNRFYYLIKIFILFSIRSWAVYTVSEWRGVVYVAVILLCWPCAIFKHHVVLRICKILCIKLFKRILFWCR